ncbi:fatty acid desaturase [Arthrobacter sp. UYP6]
MSAIGRPAAAVLSGNLVREKFMSATKWCLAVGLVLGIVLGVGGWYAFLLAVLFGLVGLLVGMAADGKLDLQSMFGRASSR